MPFAYFKPKHVSEAKLLAEHARKILHRRKDVLSDVTIADTQAEIDRLEAAIKAGDAAAIEKASQQLDVVFAKVQPARSDSSLRENCEVILVAFVLAIAIRAYFLQPFKIPTGSMQPTLNGVIGRALPPDQPMPGVLRKTFESLWLGRTYVEAVSEADDEVIDIKAEKRFGFMDYARIVCASGRSYLVHASPRTVGTVGDNDGFGVFRGRHFRAGEPIVRGYVDTGDQVFVDKFTYNFRLPRRSDVFVFNTLNISGIPMDDPNIKSQFYIKRLAGVPGDELRIEQPCLYVNGHLAEEPGFVRVMQRKDGYRGYSNFRSFSYLTVPEDVFTVPKDSYFALGDNSFNSSDSRRWGTVPAENVVGRGLFVYWPFSRHWGITR